ncbi:MAG TPA: ribbon-helix-helix protein, CopG family [Candidatus Rubrimentiphilum sp.]|nr:ribbon-helix-helix protein, CopG family [Candidatus Rubrimentiphilum sp.]
MHRIQIQLTSKQEKALREMARLRGESISALVRESVDRLVEPEAKATAERWERARAVVGKFHSGKPSNAGQHDDYFAAAIAKTKTSS